MAMIKNNTVGVTAISAGEHHSLAATSDDKEKADAINKKFVSEAAKAGLVNLAGHRLVGGMRASIYNYMPVDGVKALVEFMKKFEKENA